MPELDGKKRIIDYETVINPDENYYVPVDNGTEGTGKVSVKMVGPSDMISDAYDATSTYKVGDLCIYNNKLYVCTVDIDTPHAFDLSEWDPDTLGNYVSEIKSSLSANYVFGNQVNIINYSSSSNMFKAPSDGYILVQTWNNDSPINLWIGANSLSIPITNTTLKAFALFAKKGTSYWIGRTGTNNSAMFLPLVMEQ